MGLKPYTLTVSAKPGDESSQRTIFPSAVVRYGDRVEPVDLSSNKGETAEDKINNAESLLEFKFASAIYQLARKSRSQCRLPPGQRRTHGPAQLRRP